MGIFGWSYPPGCSSVPGDESWQCEVCGMVDDCCCPECEVCGEQGNSECYEPLSEFNPKHHGMIMNAEQRETRAKADAREQAEREMWEARAALETNIDSDEDIDPREGD